MRIGLRITIAFALGLPVLGGVGGGTWRPNVPDDGDDGECTASDAPTKMPADTSTDLRLVLNVPAYRLDVIEAGRATRSIRVAVGQPKYRTPLGHYWMDYMVWNPWWRPPPSEWARKERPQSPGWSNPVGRVKLHVTGLVFLHGTPLQNTLGTAASHACVRMSNEDAIALARIVHGRAGLAAERALIDTLVSDTSRTTTLTLTVAVPVDIEYVLAETRDSELVVYRDIYLYGGRRVESTHAQARDP